jgi:hypothetical protein
MFWVTSKIGENITDAVGNPDKYSSLHSFAVANEILGCIADWLAAL